MIDAHGGPTWTEAGRDALVEAAGAEFPGRRRRILAAAAGEVVGSRPPRARDLIRRHTAESLTTSVGDAATHLARLVRPGFVASAAPPASTTSGATSGGSPLDLRKLPEAPRRGTAANLAEVLPLER